MEEPVIPTHEYPYIRSSLDQKTSHSYQKLLNYLSEGVLELSPEGKIIEINSACMQIFGFRRTDLKSLSFMPDEGIAFFDLSLRELSPEEYPHKKLLRREYFREEKYVLQNQNSDHKVYVSLTGIPEFGPNDSFIGGTLIVKDISEFIKTRQQLNREIDLRIRHDADIQQYKQRLDKKKEQLQNIIDRIPVMIVVYDKSVEEVSINDAFINLTGWTPDDITETPIMELAYPDPEYRKEIQSFMQTLAPGFRDMTLQKKDGSFMETSWANVSISESKSMGVGIDISERKKLEAALVEAKSKAEHENQVQTAFIQNISHEVRTPMNSILGFTELLQKNITDPKLSSYLDAIDFNGAQLLRLIDDIVDLSRLDKNELSLSLENIELKTLVQQTRKQFPGLKKQYQKTQLDLRFKSFPKETGELILHTDVQRLQQVLLNLICNSLKYTEKGSVEVGVEYIEGKNQVRFYVKDTGIGIDKKDHSRVFKRFNRLHDHRQTHFRGTGLGLAICRHLVEILKGEIGFESEIGDGSVFYFTHPVLDVKSEKPKQDCQSDVNQSVEIPDLKTKTILVAEDDIYSYELMKQMLLETGASILHAETGPEALTLFRSYPIDLIFLDIRLPEMSGYQVLENIRKENTTIPVIAQTANALPEDRVKSLNAGFNHHATKPVKSNELYGLLNRFLVTTKR